MRSVFALADRARFRVHLFATSPSDGSELRQEIAASVEHFVEIHQLPLSEALAAVRAARLDIMVDLNGVCRIRFPSC